MYFRVLFWIEIGLFFGIGCVYMDGIFREYIVLCDILVFNGLVIDYEGYILLLLYNSCYIFFEIILIINLRELVVNIE